MTTTIRIEGLEALERKLGRAVADSTIRAALQAGANHIHAKVERYPPATDANREPSGSGWWYVRGTGGFYKRKDGTRRATSSSERLESKWSVQVKRREAIIGNSASYARYVHDPRDQARWMKRIGWKTTKEIADEEGKVVLYWFVQHIERALR